MKLRTFEDIEVSDMAHKVLKFFAEDYHVPHHVKNKYIAELIVLDLIEVTVRDYVRELYKITPRGEDILKQLEVKKNGV